LPTVVALPKLPGQYRPQPQGHQDLSYRWVGAGDLKKGDEVRKADGSVGIVEAIHTIYNRQTMYNLSVDTAHTYFVGHGQWLVHNCSTKLDRNLGGVVGDKKQAHHLIPEELFASGNPFLARATAGGFQMDNAYNGLLMPDSLAGGVQAGMPFHRGSHPNYTNYVRGELRDLELLARQQGWSSARSAQEAQALAQRLRVEVISKGSGQSLNQSFP
jgi:hypothetical protein